MPTRHLQIRPFSEGIFIHNNYKIIFPPTKITIYSERDMIIIKPSRIQKNSEDLNINSLKACIIIRRIIIIQIKQWTNFFFKQNLLRNV